MKNGVLYKQLERVFAEVPLLDGEQKVCGDLTKPPKVCRDTFCEFPTLYVMKMPRQKSVWKTKKCVGDCEKKRGPTKKCVKTEKMRV